MSAQIPNRITRDSALFFLLCSAAWLRFTVLNWTLFGREEILLSIPVYVILPAVILSAVLRVFSRLIPQKTASFRVILLGGTALAYWIVPLGNLLASRLFSQFDFQPMWCGIRLWHGISGAFLLFVGGGLLFASRRHVAACVFVSALMLAGPFVLKVPFVVSYLSADIYSHQVQAYYDSLDIGEKFVRNNNVYHLQLESFGSPVSVKKRFNIDTEPIYRELENLGMVMYRRGLSNRERTIATLRSMWNFTLKPDDQYGSDLREIGIEKNKVFGTFVRQGYAVYCGYCAVEIEGHLVCLNEGKTLVERFQNLSFYYMSFYCFYELAKTINEWGESPGSGPLTLDYQYEKFSRSQILAPSSFSFFHDGNMYVRKGFDPARKAAVEPVRRILEDDPDAIILLLSDHGNRKEFTQRPYMDTPEDNFRILFGMRFPEGCTMPDPTAPISLVNVYEYVFACLEGKDEVETLPNNAYMRGKTMYYLYDGYESKPLYQFIEDGTTLAEPRLVEE